LPSSPNYISILDKNPSGKVALGLKWGLDYTMMGNSKLRREGAAPAVGEVTAAGAAQVFSRETPSQALLLGAVLLYQGNIARCKDEVWLKCKRFLGLGRKARL
jgi:hypothetical protein